MAADDGVRKHRHGPRKSKGTPSADTAPGISAKALLLLSALVLLVLAMGFNALFNWTALDKLYFKSSLSKYEVIARNAVFKIENGTYFGQDIHQFHRMERLLDKTGKSLSDQYASDGYQGDPGRASGPPSTFELSLVLPDGRVRYRTQDGIEDTATAGESDAVGRRESKIQPPAAADGRVADEHRALLKLPIRVPDTDQKATLVIRFPAGARARFTAALVDPMVNTLGFILAVIAPVMILLLAKSCPKSVTAKQLPRKRLSLLIVLFIFMAQLIFSLLNLKLLADHLVETSRQKTQVTAQLLQEDLASICRKSIHKLEFPGGDELLRQAGTGLAPPYWITLRDQHGNLLHQSSRHVVAGKGWTTTGKLEQVLAMLGVEQNSDTVRFALNRPDGGKANLVVTTSHHNLLDQLIEVFLDSLTVIVISTLLVIELLILVFWIMEKRARKTRAEPNANYMVMRPAAFLFLFGIDIPMSFLPLHMARLYEPMFGLPKDVIIGLPITVEFIFVGLAIFFAGIWADRRGWHEPFLLGIFCAATGTLYSWLAPGAMQFILSRAITGCGYGFALMASQGYVITYSHRNGKAHALAQLVAGIYAGSICGTATGAMLADRFGYNSVFLVGAVILYSVIIYSLLFMRNAMHSPQSQIQTTRIRPAQTVGPEKYFAFLSNRFVLSLIFLSSLPASIVSVGFLNYFCPIYMHGIGASQSTIGRVLMLYGISLIYIGPMIGRYVDDAVEKRRYVFIGCALGSVTFFSFSILPGLWAATFAVFILGLSSSFVLASQSAYILQLKVTRELGEGRAIGIFRSTSRIGQALGPLAFGAIMIAGNLNQMITLLGWIYLLTALLFFLFTVGEHRPAPLDPLERLKNLERLENA